ncbi:ArsR/SmtB family transcription factor [Vagococcus acidifermentans]|uniref:Transcriptional regulator n=1 Tax=Vagococcus acidifermentans TaxID=564710 RepID=A0A430AXW6_9ENTE|nr:metalloregulator ArsR/SmtB family transcription factor [Vagococcus acidifermentans]RSU12888.1 transcriptional regulator [Vagococcus acidifermentans]
MFEGVTEEDVYQVSQFFKTLSEPTRLNILLALSTGELNVGAIAEQLHMEQSAISHQLKLLRLNHLVKSRKEGKTVFYSLDDQHVVDILSKTFHHLSHD